MSYELHTYVDGRTGVYGPLCEHHKDTLVAKHKGGAQAQYCATWGRSRYRLGF